MRNRGYYSGFGGAYIPEILVATFDELEDAFEGARSDPSFWESYQQMMASYCGRATPLTLAENLSERFGGARIYIKREDLNHTGAHKANNVMGQGLLVKRMGKTRVIAETGAGQHGIATATMAARFGLQCTIYMGEVDVARQRPNVFWMERLGATVIPVRDGSRTLKDAVNEAFRDWMTYMDTTHYVLGTACGPHPFPEMITYFQSIIGREAAGRCSNRPGSYRGASTHAWAAVRTPWASSVVFWMTTSSSWAPKPAVVDWAAAGTRRALRAAKARSGSLRATRAISFRTETVRCARRTALQPDSTTSECPPSWRTCNSAAERGSKPSPTAKSLMRWR